MKRFLIIVSALLVCLVCRAAYYEADYYSLSLGDKYNIDSFQDTVFDYCGLSLLKDGRYVISISNWESDDMLFTDNISMGKYTNDGDTIYFTDKFTSYRFEAVFNDEEITFTKGFPFMIGKTLTFCCTTKNDYYDSYYDMHKNLFSEKIDSVAFGEPFYPLEYKSYQAHRYSLPYNLIINEDGTYSIVYGGLMFSEGNWERIGNIIRLKDSHLNHNHYVLIKENKLVMCTIDITCDKISLK